MVYEVKKSYKNMYQYNLKDNILKYYELTDNYKMKKISENKDNGQSKELYDKVIDYFKKNHPTSFETLFDDQLYKIEFYYGKEIYNGEKIRTSTFSATFENKKDYNKVKKEINIITKRALKRNK
jgi:hypothetical protein